MANVRARGRSSPPQRNLDRRRHRKRRRSQRWREERQWRDAGAQALARGIWVGFSLQFAKANPMREDGTAAQSRPFRR